MRRLGARVCAFLLPLAAAAAAAAFAEPLPVDVLAPDKAHVVWASAARLAELTRSRGLELAPGLATSPRSDASLLVMSLQDFASFEPAVSVLSLPFFYSNLTSIHRAVDGPLGAELRAAAERRGWRLLGFWDEGLELMSGNYAYTQKEWLVGKEFVLLRDDPVAEMSLRALDVWTRRVRPSSLAQLQTECLVSSRSVTAQQIVREQLARVHLDVTLSRHRYDGWVVAMPMPAWRRLDPVARSALVDALWEMSAWQRERAQDAENRALAALKRDGMTLHPLPSDAWQEYQKLQPAWESLLPEALPIEDRRRLVTTAKSSAPSGASAREPEHARSLASRAH